MAKGVHLAFLTVILFHGFLGRASRPSPHGLCYIGPFASAIWWTALWAARSGTETCTSSSWS